MSTRSGCVTMDFVMESAVITQKRAVASNNAPADEPKSRGHNPERSKTDVMDWGNRLLGKCPLCGYIR